MNNPAPAVSFIYVNYNLTDEIVASVNTLVQFAPPVPFEIIVVNNGSEEPQAASLLQMLPPPIRRLIQVVLLDENKGFGTGNNAGIKVALGEYLFLVNPDTRFTEGVTEKLYNFAKNLNKPAVIAPVLKDSSSAVEISYGKFPSLMSEFFAAIFLERLFFQFVLPVNSGKVVQVDWVTGAAIFIRKTDFLKVGGFDEQIFLYNEEVDLAKRLHSLGIYCYLLPDVHLVHLKSVGSKKDYYRFTVNSYTSKIYYLKKHFSGSSRQIAMLLMAFHLVLLFIIWFFLIPVVGEKAKSKCAAIPHLFGELIA